MRKSRALGAALWLGLAALLSAGALGGSTARIRSSRPLGPYLAVEIRPSGGRDLSLLLPAAPQCARIARAEAPVRWVARGFPGRLEAGGEACEAAGILDLAAWRDRRPRPEVPGLPRKTARWTVFHRDGGLALLRGRFPLAGLVGMAGGYDLVAVVPDDGSCAGALLKEVGSLEYRSSGRAAYRLIVGGSPCPVLGFARPVRSSPSGPSGTREPGGPGGPEPLGPRPAKP